MKISSMMFRFNPIISEAIVTHTWSSVEEVAVINENSRDTRDEDNFYR